MSSSSIPLLIQFRLCYAFDCDGTPCVSMCRPFDLRHTWIRAISSRHHLHLATTYGRLIPYITLFQKAHFYFIPPRFTYLFYLCPHLSSYISTFVILELTYCPLSAHTPIIGVDIWEHAFYLQYKNVKPDVSGLVYFFSRRSEIDILLCSEYGPNWFLNSS